MRIGGTRTLQGPVMLALVNRNRITDLNFDVIRMQLFRLLLPVVVGDSVIAGSRLRHFQAQLSTLLTDLMVGSHAILVVEAIRVFACSCGD